MIGVGEVPVAVARARCEDPGDRPRLDAVRVGVDPKPFEQREDLEQDEPLRVGWDDRDVEVTERAAERREDERAVLRQILDRDRTAGIVEPADVRRADIAPIEGVGPSLRDPGER